MTDFDYVIERRGTDCLKYDFAVERGKPADALPLWVADMDFPAPEGVLEALRRRVSHGIFGYTDVKPAYAAACAGWFDRQFGWRPQEEWLAVTPGVVFALAMAVRALTQAGDGVLLNPPVYYPFYEVIRENSRRVVECPLLEREGRYLLDMEALEAVILREKPRLYLLCSPHNPVGKVWTGEELAAIGEICRRHGIYVVSDEIHCDFAFPDHPFIPFLAASPASAEKAVICTAPSKTFNLAGLQTSNIWIPGEAVRVRFRREVTAAGYSQPNLLGLTACQAAYETGEAWHRENLAYLRENLAFFREELHLRLPQLRLLEPEGTYFAWVDCSGLGLTPEALNAFITEKAGLWLDAGAIFGPAWGQYQRFVLAAPRAVLAQALNRLENAVKDR